jgi:HEAT repeat protein
MPHFTRAAWAAVLLAGLGLTLAAPAARAQNGVSRRAGPDRSGSTPWSSPEALNHLGPEDTAAIPALIELLDRPDRTWQHAAGQALVRIGAPGRSQLIQALLAAEVGHRTCLEQALGLHGKAAWAAVRPLLSSDRPHVRDRALSVLIRLGPEARENLSQLLSLAARAGAVEQERIARTLGRMGPAALPVIETGLDHEHPLHRRVCARALVLAARIFGPAAAEARHALVNVATSPDPSLDRAIRDAAATALMDLEIPAPTLARDLDHALRAGEGPSSSPDVRALENGLSHPRAARRLLSALGLARAGPSAHPVLKRALGSDRAATRQAATWALVHLESTQIQNDIRETYGPLLTVRVGHGFFPRALWPKAHARALKPDQIPRVVGFVARALASYPPRLVRRTLAHIKLCRTLRVLGTPYGGTFEPGTVYLACGDRAGPELMRAFHHEFSSLLMRAAEFPTDAWSRTNAPGFSYGGGGRQAIVAGQVGYGNIELYRAGFFTPYARADLENDVNVFSETVFHDPYGARILIAHHPRLLTRWRVWIAFFHELDPAFDEESVLGSQTPVVAE